MVQPQFVPKIEHSSRLTNFTVDMVTTTYRCQAGEVRLRSRGLTNQNLASGYIRLILALKLTPNWEVWFLIELDKLIKTEWKSR